jgi:hypothetical protein
MPLNAAGLITVKAGEVGKEVPVQRLVALGRAGKGASGGPVVDAGGRVVGLVNGEADAISDEFRASLTPLKDGDGSAGATAREFVRAPDEFLPSGIAVLATSAEIAAVIEAVEASR